VKALALEQARGRALGQARGQALEYYMLDEHAQWSQRCHHNDILVLLIIYNVSLFILGM
jgi:hypothetical protein